MTFPVDPRGLTRDEVLRRPYARRRAVTRAEFVRRLVDSLERPPLTETVHVGLYQLPEPRHFAGGYPRQPLSAEAAVRAFLSSPRPRRAPRYFAPSTEHHEDEQ